MRTSFHTAFLLALLSQSAVAQQTIAGDWMVTIHEQFGPNVMRLTLAIAGEKVTGTAGSRRLEGTVRGTTVDLTMDKVTVKGSLEGAELKGEAIFPDRTVKWTAARIPPRPST